MLHTRLFRVTTPTTDLYRGRGYKYADNAAQLNQLTKKVTAVKIEVKDETATGVIYYKALNDADLATLTATQEA